MIVQNTRAQVIDGLIADQEASVISLRDKLVFEERYLADLRQRREAISAATTQPAPPRPPEPQAANGTGENVEAGRLPQHMFEVLRHAKGPLTIRDITRRVESRGVASQAKGGVLSLVSSTVSRRKDLFVRVGIGLVDLAERHAERKARNESNE